MNAPLTASTGPRSIPGARYCASGPPAARLPIPLRWESAARTVGNDRREAWSKLPSGRSRRQPAMPTSGRSRITSRRTSSVPALSSASGFRASTYGAVPSRIAAFVAAAKPTLRSFAIRRTAGNRSRTSSTVPSFEALSTTQVVVPAGACSSMLVRQRRSRSRHRCETTATSRRPVMRSSFPAAVGAAGSLAVEILARSSGATSRLPPSGKDGAARCPRPASPRIGPGSRRACGRPRVGRRRSPPRARARRRRARPRGLPTYGACTHVRSRSGSSCGPTRHRASPSASGSLARSARARIARRRLGAGG